MSKYSCCGDVPYEFLVKFMQKMSEVPANKKEKYIQQFLQMCVPRCTPDIFQIFRLLLPLDDMERRSYRMKQEKLAEVLVDAAGLSRQNPEAKRAINWRQAGVRNAGNFPEVVEQYVLRRACLAPDDPARNSITIADINAHLDRLAAQDADKKAQAGVFRELMGRCTARQMKWLVRIVLKEIKIGLSQQRLMTMFHPDALYLLQMTSDLQYVCSRLADPNTKEPRMDIEPGRCVMAQRCVRVNTVDDMFKGMKGQPFTVEMKFDGNRMQLHKTPQGTFYFSRRGREHGELTGYTVFDKVLHTQVSASRVVLDGELIVWNKMRGVFEPFGGLRSTVNAANEGAPPDKIVLMTDNWGQTGPTLGSSDPEYLHPTAGDLELVYVAFDILFDEHESLITLPLRQRQQRLAQAVKCLPADAEAGLLLGPEGGCIRGRIVTLLPDVPLALPIVGAATAVPTGSDLAGCSSSSCPATPELMFSRKGHTQQDLQDMMEAANARQEEGIVAKQLDSQWKADDKSGSWLKLKPDYFHMQEVDAVIIGGYYGSGRHGGLVSEFLLGLTEGGGVAGVLKWCSFCRVGTGMSDVDRGKMRQKLEPVLMEAGPGVKAPTCYRVTGREKPDFWVTDPTRSIVVEVTSDIRTIASNTYAADHSLRFPRIKRIRWDRDPTDITTYPELEQMVLENKGRLASIKMGLQAGVDIDGLRRWGARRRAGAAGKGSGKPRVVDALALPDIKGVESRSELLSGATCYFHNYADPSLPESAKAAAKKELGAIVAAHGGIVVAAPTPETDYVFAAVLRLDFVEAQRRLEAKKPGSVHDVLAVDWLRDMDAAGEPIDIMPRHYLFMSAATRTDESWKDEVDDFGNPWYTELEVEDVEALVDRLVPASAYTTYQQQLAQGSKLQEQQEDEALAAEGGAVTPVKPGTRSAGRKVPKGLASAGSPPDPSSAGSLEGRHFKTEESAVLSLQKQLQALAGWRDKSAVLFSGCCLLFVLYSPEVHSTAAVAAAAADGSGGGDVGSIHNQGLQGLLTNPQQQQQQQQQRYKDTEPSSIDVPPLVLSSALAAQQLAVSWQHLQDLQQLSEAKLAVVQHGGTVAATYSSAVTHVVLWPLGWRRQQLAGGVLFGAAANQQQQQQQQRLLLPQVVSVDEEQEGGTEQQQQQRVGLPVQQLLQLLAATASAAADGGVTAAASKAAAATVAAFPTAAAAGRPASDAAGSIAVVAPAKASSRSSVLRPSRGRFKIAAQPAAAAVPGASPAVQSSTQTGVQQLTARLASGAAAGNNSGGVMEALLADRTAAAATAGVPERPPPSPAALKLLRKIRRRLLVAQDNLAAHVPEAAAEAGRGVAGLFEGAGQAPAAAVGSSGAALQRSRSRSRHNPLRPLILVSPGWVVDSILDLQQQLQQQHSRLLTHIQSFTQQQQTQLGSGSFTQLPLSQALSSFDSQLGFDLPEFELRQQRRNEAIYLVQVQAAAPQQQQQQQGERQEDGGGGGGGGDESAAAAAAADGLPVQAWPWEIVGLANRQAGGSSEDSSDGALSDQPSDRKAAAKPRAKCTTAAAASRARIRKTADSDSDSDTAAAADSDDTEHIAAAPRAKAGSTAAATAAAKRPAAKRARRKVTKIRSPSPEADTPAAAGDDSKDAPNAAAGGAATQAGIVADSYEEDVGGDTLGGHTFDPTAAVSQAPPSSRTRAGRSQTTAAAAAALAAAGGTKRTRAAAGTAAGGRSSKRAKGGTGRTRIRPPADEVSDSAGDESAGVGISKQADGESAGAGMSHQADSDGEEGGTAAVPQHRAVRGRRGKAAAATAGEGEEQEEPAEQQQPQQGSGRRLRHMSSVKGAAGKAENQPSPPSAAAADGAVEHKAVGVGRVRRGGHTGVQALFDDLAEEVTAEPPSAAVSQSVPQQHQQQQQQQQLSQRAGALAGAGKAQQQQRSGGGHSNPTSQAGGGGSLFDALFSGNPAAPPPPPPAAAAERKQKSKATSGSGAGPAAAADTGQAGPLAAAAKHKAAAAPSAAAGGAGKAATSAASDGVSLSSFLFGGGTAAAAPASAAPATKPEGQLPAEAATQRRPAAVTRIATAAGQGGERQTPRQAGEQQQDQTQGTAGFGEPATGGQPKLSQSLFKQTGSTEAVSVRTQGQQQSNAPAAPEAAAPRPKNSLAAKLAKLGMVPATDSKIG